ncbi:hypothetical protein SCP_0100200 [Sparassis crispa]|uniref:Uncharacterized protein n=1 Tax=Sparassis crispa TaxID=139825 RepID=A0A401G4N1_9APHY|nr:hypothetical protein SCP_0100200 [Sparassis crispa]GBE77148.1 hypothetical protein SCP_0100200 [Sparassis crispa]
MRGAPRASLALFVPAPRWDGTGALAFHRVHRRPILPRRRSSFRAPSATTVPASGPSGVMVVSVFDGDEVSARRSGR